MMAGLFGVCALAMALAAAGKRDASTATWLIGVVLSTLWFWHHVTDALQVDL